MDGCKCCWVLVFVSFKKGDVMSMTYIYGTTQLILTEWGSLLNLGFCTLRSKVVFIIPLS